MKRLFTLVALTLALTGAKADVVINATNFPDENFRAQVAEYDTDGDGVLSDEEMETGFFGLVNFGYNVTNFKGIELLTKLTDVSIGYSSLEDPSLTSFDYALPNLTWIEFHDAGNLTTIDLSKCPKLEVFQANGVPKLSTLNVPTGITSFGLGSAPLIKTFDPKQFQKLHQPLEDSDDHSGRWRRQVSTQLARHVELSELGEHRYQTCHHQVAHLQVAARDAQPPRV